jgi:hypothetical protein
MYDLVPSGWAQHRGLPDDAYVQNSVSNTTLIGHDAWADHDMVRRVSFRIVGLDPLFRNSLHFRDVIDSEFSKLPELIAFEARTASAVVKGRFAPSGNLISQRTREVTSWIDMEFSEGQSLTDMRLAADCVSRYFSCCSGVHLRATEHIVSRYAEVEILDRIAASKPIFQHRVFYYHDIRAKEAEEVSPYSTLVTLWSEDGRAALEAGLITWMERNDQWVSATAMMMDCLSKQRMMSSSRLLSATRWLEEIPGSGSHDVISQSDAKALGKLVGNAAKKLGYGPVAGRFKNAISRIALESNRERLKRLVGKIRYTFGLAILDDDLVEWLIEALSMRGSAAHGATAALDEDYDAFSRAVEAVECLNALLMLRDLPLGDEAAARASQHPLVENYRNCLIKGPPKKFRAEVRRRLSTEGR